MRNPLSLTIALLLTCFVAQGQQEPITFGLKAGLNAVHIAMADLPLVEDYERRLLFHAGGFAEVSLSRRFTLRPELMYSQKGGEYEYFTLTNHYLSLPVLLQYQLGAISLRAGSELGYKLKSSLQAVDPDLDHLVSIFDRELELGLAGGVGLQWDRFGVEGRYVHSLSNLTHYTFFDENGLPIRERGIGQHRVWQLSLNFRI